MTLLQHHILALWLTALTSLGFGLLLFISDPKRFINRIVALYGASLALWGISESFEISATTVGGAGIWSIARSIGVGFIAPTFLHTIILVTGDRHRLPRFTLALGYCIGIVFAVLRWLLPATVVGQPQPVAYTNYHTPLTPLGSLLGIVFFVVVNVGFVRLWHALRHSAGQRRTQIKFLFWSSVIGYVGGTPDWTFAFGFAIPLISPFGIYTVPLHSIAIAYAVLRHRLFDVSFVIRKSLVYSLLVTILTISYFGLIFGVEKLFSVTLGYQSVWVSVTAFAVMALLFQPLKLGIQRLVDLLLFRVPHEELVKRMERLEQEIRHADKLKAVSTLAAGMAHEIKNPLTSLKTFTAYLSEKGTDPAFQQKFQRVVTQEVNKIDQIVRRLLEFARPAPLKLETTKASQLLDETLDLLSSEALRRRVEIERAYDDADAIQADPQQLRQVFLNLFLNSLDAMTPPPARLPEGPAPSGAAPPSAEAAGGGVNGSGGKLSVATARNGSSLTITIHDTGHGIPKEHLNHIFDPFFTTKPTGTGLGLSIVQSIVAEHHGTITFDSQPNHGTTCALTFPLATPGANYS